MSQTFEMIIRDQLDEIIHTTHLILDEADENKPLQEEIKVICILMRSLELAYDEIDRLHGWSKTNGQST